MKSRLLLLLLFIFCLPTEKTIAQDWNPSHPSWTDSFEANGFCWCNSTNYDHGLIDKSVTVNGVEVNIKTLCEELEKHPSYRAYVNGDAPYNDIQCGNGPANDADDETGCPGRTDIGPDGCNVIGPKWDWEWLETRFGNVTPTCDSVSAFSTIEAEDFCDQSGIQTQTGSEGTNVGWVHNGDWIKFDDVAFGSGANKFSARVASNTSGGTIEIRSGSTSGTLLGTVAVSNTGDWQDWVTETSSITNTTGTNDIYLVFTGGSNALLNINWFTFSSETTNTCSLPWSDNDFTVSQETVTYSSDSVDISCASSSLTVSMDIEGVGPMETADYLNVYYKVDGGSQQVISENTNAFSSKTVSVSGITGDTIEIIINAKTSYGDETYSISNITISTSTDTPSTSFSRIEAEEYDGMSGIQTEASTEGTDNVGWINNGDWTRYDNIDLTGALSIDTRIACNYTGGTIEVRIDSVTGPLLGTISISNTGGNQAWQTNSTNITSVTGTHDVYLVYTGGNGYLFNINWLQFSSTSKSSTLLDKLAAIKITPVPFGNTITIENAKDNSLQVFNSIGKKVMTMNITNDLQSIDVSGLSQGMYFAKSTGLDGKISTLKLIKK
ncbi:carbohydrate-binding protein [Aquimarina pacifica]|uniref:carbohydrate-binding protein n=1 Tax=Aquimarina pacifica TaxID=1296415 RepID=UPI00046FED58|nr:carbohydrate-binding protein [Aquimarina pacifica]